MRKYPRKVSIHGKSFTVKSAKEEAQLLEEAAKKNEEQSAILKGLGDKDSAKRAERKAAMAQGRAQKASQNWFTKLRQDDEQILLLLTA